MRHVETRAVAAPAEVVWEVLVDVTRWPTWTRSMTAVDLDGPLSVGTEVRIRQPRLPPATWTVTELEPGRSFTWEARAPGVVSTAVHRVEAGAAGTSVVTLVLVQGGPLGGALGRVLGRMARRYVRMEADGLEREAIRRTSTG